MDTLSFYFKTKTNCIILLNCNLHSFPVYPSGGMLEMSNGYPGSGSPLDAGCTPSPSPGPAPSPHRHGHKAHGHAPPPHHSPRHNNLRVVIPSSMPPPQDDISYAGEVIVRHFFIIFCLFNPIPFFMQRLFIRYRLV